VVNDAMSNMQMFSQVPKTSAIIKHTIHFDTHLDFCTLLFCFDLNIEEDLDLHPDACSSYNDPSIESLKSTFKTAPTRLERS
jgi:hypothetical protein